jgi:hypothetical protein
LRIAEVLLESEEVSALNGELGNRREHNTSGTGLVATRSHVSGATPHRDHTLKAISQRYHSASKYNGNADDVDAVSFPYFAQQYQLTMEELEVTRDQRASFVHHALKGPALETFHSDFLGRVTQIAEVNNPLEANFLGESLKLGIRTKPSYYRCVLPISKSRKTSLMLKRLRK